MMLWRWFFGFCAVWNLAIGANMLLTADQLAASMQMTTGAYLYAVQLSGELIGIFGLGYALVAHNPAGNRGIVWMGMIGKLGASALAVLNKAVLPDTVFWFGIGDVAFALVFAVFLFTTRRA